MRRAGLKRHCWLRLRFHQWALLVEKQTVICVACGLIGRL
jgi:hypothetical protein